MSYKGGACKQYDTLLDTLYKQQQINNRVFSFYFSPMDNVEKDNVKKSITQDSDNNEQQNNQQLLDTRLQQHHSKQHANYKHSDALKLNKILSKSQFVIGLPDRRLYSGHLNYVDILRSKHSTSQMWFTRLHRLSIDNGLFSSLSLCTALHKPCVVLPDSGTSFITLPSSRFIDIIQSITHNRNDCITDVSGNQNTVFCLDGPEGM